MAQRALGRIQGAARDSLVRRTAVRRTALAPQVVQAGLARLTEDLRSGRWDAQFGWLRDQESLDLGYRLIMAQK